MGWENERAENEMRKGTEEIRKKAEDAAKEKKEETFTYKEFYDYCYEEEPFVVERFKEFILKKRKG